MTVMTACRLLLRNDVGSPIIMTISIHRKLAGKKRKNCTKCMGKIAQTLRKFVPKLLVPYMVVVYKFIRDFVYVK